MGPGSAVDKKGKKLVSEASRTGASEGEGAALFPSPFTGSTTGPGPRLLLYWLVFCASWL